MSFHETQEAEQTCRALVDELIIIDIIDYEGGMKLIPLTNS